MRTKDLIAKRLRREKALQRKNRNQQESKRVPTSEVRELEYTIPSGFPEDVQAEAQR